MKILFIGNSHTFFNEMPHTVAELYRMSGLKTPDVVMLTHGGMTLDWHADQPHVRFNIRYGGFDQIVLQDVAHPFIGHDRLISDVEKITGLIDRKISKPCLYMTWASLAHPEAQAEMIESYTDAAEKFDTLLAPVGKVWEKIRYGHPEINLFYSDGEHAGPVGSYLAACVIFCALTSSKRIAADLSDSFYDKFDKDVIQIIHNAVAEVLG